MGARVPKARCSAGDCPNPRRRRNAAWCDPHWQRYRRTGDVQADKPLATWTQARRTANTDAVLDGPMLVNAQQRWLCKPCHRFVDALIHVPAYEVDAR